MTKTYYVKNYKATSGKAKAAMLILIGALLSGLVAPVVMYASASHSPHHESKNKACDNHTHKNNEAHEKKEDHDKDDLKKQEKHETEERSDKENEKVIVFDHNEREDKLPIIENEPTPIVFKLPEIHEPEEPHEDHIVKIIEEKPIIIDHTPIVIQQPAPIIIPAPVTVTNINTNTQTNGSNTQTQSSINNNNNSNDNHSDVSVNNTHDIAISHN